MASSGVIEEFPIEKEYEKNPDITPDDIAKLREWLQTQPHLPREYITDLDLLLTFYCCEKSQEVTKQVLDLHFTLRTLFVNYFKDRAIDDKVLTCMDTILFAPLPLKSVHGYSTIYCRLFNPDPKNFNFNHLIRNWMMIFDLWQREEGTWPGFVLVIDMDQAALAHIMKLEVMTLRQILYFLQECMLVKLKEIHFLSAPYFMDKLMSLLKPFMKKSLLDLIRIHLTGAQTIYQYVPREAFPKEAGGEHKDYKTIKEEMTLRLKNNEQYFKDENRKRVNEALRPGGKRTTVENLFGIQGSFKKLDID